MRDTAGNYAGGQRMEPAAPAWPVPAAQAAPPALAAQTLRERTFSTDRGDGEDLLGLSPWIAVLADLVLHPATESPLAIGFLGGPGEGKSFALTKLLDAVAKKGAGPVRIAALRLSASALGSEPAVALADALHAQIGPAYPDLVREAYHAVSDPHLVVRQAEERLDESRRRLEAERAVLYDIEGKRARLAETVLYEAAASQVDAYARANRPRLETRLRSFGITGDGVLNYKNLVRDFSGGGRFTGALRAFFAYKGQTKLIVTAILLVLIGFGLDTAAAHQQSWLGWMRSSNDSLVPTADWIAAHASLLGILKQACFYGAGLAILINIWRGLRFLQPIFRGASLLAADLASRRRDLDGLFAHQTRRVDALAADVDAASRRAADAAQRAGSVAASAAATEPSPFEADDAGKRAENFIRSLGEMVAAQGGKGALPHRFVVAIDNIAIGAAPPGCDTLACLHRLLATSGFISIFALDTKDIQDAEKVALARSIQVPMQIGRIGTPEHFTALIGHLLGAEQNGEAPRAPVLRRDWTITEGEARVLADLTALAGHSPRELKRFVNLYRIARQCAEEDQLAALALMLALETGGVPAEIETVDALLKQAYADAAFELPQGASGRLADALRAVETHVGRLPMASMRKAAALARPFSLRV